MLDMYMSLPSSAHVLEVFFTLSARAYALPSVAVKPLQRPEFWNTCFTVVQWSMI